MKQQEVGLVIMRPTEECNLACKYCYNPKSSDVELMKSSTLEKALRKILGFYNQITFVWHGGEATCAGLDFFKEVMRIQQRYRGEGQKVINEIQTNGTLINDQWAEFFKKNNFYVGVSIDGPKEINDIARVHNNGRGTYDDILEGIRILKRHEIPIAGICVLASHNIAVIEKVMSWYNRENLSLNINPFISSGVGYIYRHEFQISSKEYGKAMIKLFDLWFNNPSIKIYDFYKIVKSFFTGINNICSYSGKCASEFISICPNGDIYPCARWVGEEEFKMGNIDKNSMLEITNSLPVNLLSQRTSHLQECQTCQWFEICNGGCPHSAYLYTGNINNKDFYCEGRKMLFEYIYSMVSNHLEKYRQANDIKKKGGNGDE